MSHLHTHLMMLKKGYKMFCRDRLIVAGWNEIVPFWGSLMIWTVCPMQSTA